MPMELSPLCTRVMPTTNGRWISSSTSTARLEVRAALSDSFPSDYAPIVVAIINNTWFAAEIPARSGTCQRPLPNFRCRRAKPLPLQFSQNLMGTTPGKSLLGKPALWFWAPPPWTCQGEAPVVGQVAASHPK